MDYIKYENWMKELKEVGLVTDTQLIHTKILAEFNSLRVNYKVEHLENLLSEKYYLEPETIHKIVYKKCRLNRHP